jgi:RNA polymerase sigma-70 factor (ECF subfamily)
MIKPRFSVWKSEKMAAATQAWGIFAEHATGIMTVQTGGDLGRRLDTARLDNPDLSLVSRCLRGEETAWEELLRVHSRRVYGLCFRFTNSASEAQDLTQEVFIRVFRTLKSFRSTEGSFATWLARVTRNLLIDNYRRTRQERVTDSIEEQLPVIEEEGASAAAKPDQMVAGREASEILQAALQTLSPDLREAVILRDLQEMEYREIAGVLQIPEGTVKSRINRGRAELARRLKKQKLAL